MNFVNLMRPTNTKAFGHVIDELFNTKISDLVQTDFSFSKPSVNIIENDDNYKIEVAAPGLKKGDFDIKVENKQLIIKASNKNESAESETDTNYRRREFNYTSFSRSFHISDKIDSEKIGAHYEDGILTVTLEKREEAKDKGPRTIEIS